MKPTLTVLSINSCRFPAQGVFGALPFPSWFVRKMVLFAAPSYDGSYVLCKPTDNMVFFFTCVPPELLKHWSLLPPMFTRAAAHQRGDGLRPQARNGRLPISFMFQSTDTLIRHLESGLDVQVGGLDVQVRTLQALRVPFESNKLKFSCWTHGK